MRVAVFSDVHGHADALQAVMAAAVDADVAELWSLGDMVGGGPDPARVAAMVRSYCSVALVGNHDYAATGSIAPTVFGPPGSPGCRSLELAAEALAASGDLDWMRARKPAATRSGVQCWHASPRNAVWEFVATTNAEACLQRQRAAVGLVGHTHVPAAWQVQAGRAGVRTVRVRPDRPLDISQPKWMLNPGAVGAPLAATAGWCEAVNDHASRGACWLQLDVDARVATWRRAPYDPAPTIERIRAAGLAPSQTASPSRSDARAAENAGRPVACPHLVGEVVGSHNARYRALKR